ncbi:lectin B isoform 1 [Penaeus vannamei]|uniref:Lectin B isoform 1 n=1 Tax=Penaeus vannamei TaxID=6689 RepID=A0A423TI52_PENVA|nr:lectin B isoform 1 [Penaeus vannamei]
MPYQAVGGRCLLLDTLDVGTWHDTRNFCHGYQGELAQIDSADLLTAVVDFIHSQGLTGSDFWIGANNEAEEGVWQWPDGSGVHMGTPFWGYWTSPPRSQPTARAPNTPACSRSISITSMIATSVNFLLCVNIGNR